jgi:hypothetical protein
MRVASRLKKLEAKLKLVPVKIYCLSWANAEYKSSNGFVKIDGESKIDFCRRICKLTKKKYIWFN